MKLLVKYSKSAFVSVAARVTRITVNQKFNVSYFFCFVPSPFGGARRSQFEASDMMKSPNNARGFRVDGLYE